VGQNEVRQTREEITRLGAARLSAVVGGTSWEAGRLVLKRTSAFRGAYESSHGDC